VNDVRDGTYGFQKIGYFFSKFIYPVFSPTVPETVGGLPAQRERTIVEVPPNGKEDPCVFGMEGGTIGEKRAQKIAEPYHTPSAETPCTIDRRCVETNRLVAENWNDATNRVRTTLASVQLCPFRRMCQVGTRVWQLAAGDGAPQTHRKWP
jgi:hypothetical protein